MVNNKNKILGTFIILIVIASLAAPNIGLANQIPTNLQTPNTTPPNAPNATKYLYLPLVKAGLPPATTTSHGIATEMYSGSDPKYTSKAVAVNIRFARTSVLEWDKIEPNRTNPPTYLWSANVNEANLIGLSSNGITPVAIVRYAPSWAQKTPPHACGPIADSALDAFAQFMSAAVQRYSRAPYNVHYWEIGNEPDAPFIGDNRSVFGCWGDPALPYFGAGNYANALERVYPAIKAADPSAHVILGGLLLDCDPTNPPSGKDCAPAHFLEGVLYNNGKRNGATYFDMVSYHGYPIYDGTLSLDENYPSWNARGGVDLGKANFLREVMAKYGVNKPLFHSEGSLLCPEYFSFCNPATSAFFDAQADYVVWIYIRDWANNIQITSWYQYEGPGWRYSSLLDGNQNPKPAYYALQFLTNELSGANYTRQITSYPGVRIYEFTKSPYRIWVMWTPDQQNYTISLPTGTTRVLDKFGKVITPSNNQLTVNKPVYVEITP